MTIKLKYSLINLFHLNITFQAMFVILKYLHLLAEIVKKYIVFPNSVTVENPRTFLFGTKISLWATSWYAPNTHHTI